MIELLAESMAKLPDAPGFLIDGFPANMNQAKIFIEKISAPNKIFVLEVPEAVMSERLKDGVNFDDQDDTIKKRVFTFLEKIQPTIQSILRKWPHSVKIVSLVLLIILSLIQCHALSQSLFVSTSRVWTELKVFAAFCLIDL